jgi:hypothetical protein
MTASLINPNAKAKVDVAVGEALVLVDSQQLREAGLYTLTPPDP